MCSKLFFDENNDFCIYKNGDISIIKPLIHIIKIVNNFGIDSDGKLFMFRNSTYKIGNIKKIRAVEVDNTKIFTDIISSGNKIYVVDEQYNLYFIDSSYKLNKICKIKPPREIKYIHCDLYCTTVYYDNILQIVTKNCSKHIKNVSSVKFYKTFIETTVNNKKFLTKYEYFTKLYDMVWISLICVFLFILTVALIWFTVSSEKLCEHFSSELQRFRSSDILPMHTLDITIFELCGIYTLYIILSILICTLCFSLVKLILIFSGSVCGTLNSCKTSCFEKEDMLYDSYCSESTDTVVSNTTRKYSHIKSAKNY